MPGCYAVPATSKNKEAAFEAVRCIAENQYTLGYGRVPARVDLSDEEINDYIENGLVPTYAATDDIPAEQFRAAWFDSSRKVLSEKIVGTADTTPVWTTSTLWASRTLSASSPARKRWPPSAAAACTP